MMRIVSAVFAIVVGIGRIVCSLATGPLEPPYERALQPEVGPTDRYGQVDEDPAESHPDHA